MGGYTMVSVDCCGRSKEHRIYYDPLHGCFYMAGMSNIPVEYCPFCGKMLDTNLFWKGENEPH